MSIITLSPADFPEAVNRAVRVLANGGILALPFDTVYGFACDAYNETAIKRIYELKKRDLSKPLGLAFSGEKEAERAAETDWRTREFIRAKTPGRFTFILPVKPDFKLSSLTYRNHKVAVRIPDSSLIRSIAKLFPNPLAQTSANKAGMPDCDSVYELKKQFTAKELASIDLIIDGGKIENARPSQIIDLTKESPHRIERK